MSDCTLDTKKRFSSKLNRIILFYEFEKIPSLYRYDRGVKLDMFNTMFLNWIDKDKDKDKNKDKDMVPEYEGSRYVTLNVRFLTHCKMILGNSLAENKTLDRITGGYPALAMSESDPASHKTAIKRMLEHNARPIINKNPIPRRDEVMDDKTAGVQFLNYHYPMDHDFLQ